MNNRPFPPIILTHLTKDNALFHGTCKSGLDKFINTHQLSHLTAISVSLLLKSKKLTPNEIYWIKYIAGLDVNKTQYGSEYENEYPYGYGYGNKHGDGFGIGHGDGGVNGDGNGDGDSDEDGMEMTTNPSNTLESIS